jgi:2-iminobutanoate/2-iminopropanoate deaminase
LCLCIVGDIGPALAALDATGGALDADPATDVTTIWSSTMTVRYTVAGDSLPGGFPFSLAVGADEMCFVSGMPALDADGVFVPGTFAEELELAWGNVVRIAAAAGYSAADVVFIQCALAEITDYDALNSWWRLQFPEQAPARFTFQAGALPFGAKVELQAVVGRGGPRS